MPTNGRTIIGDALALCNYLAQHPDAHYWFDWSGAYGSTDELYQKGLVNLVSKKGVT